MLEKGDDAIQIPDWIRFLSAVPTVPHDLQFDLRGSTNARRGNAPSSNQLVQNPTVNFVTDYQPESKKRGQECPRFLFEFVGLSESRQDRIAHATGADFGFTWLTGGDVAGAETVGDGFGHSGFNSLGRFGFSEGETEEHRER